MAIGTYSQLQTAVLTWLDRTTDTDLTARVPDLIKLAESELNNILRVREMEATATLSPTSGLYTLPSDYLSYRNVTALTNPRASLEYATPEYLDWRYGDREQGSPALFTVIGGSIRLAPATPNDIELRYYKRLNIATDTTNWLLTNNPDIYLFGTLIQAGAYTEIDNDRLLRWRAMYQTAVDGLKLRSLMSSMGKGGARVRYATP